MGVDPSHPQTPHDHRSKAKRDTPHQGSHCQVHTSDRMSPGLAEAGNQTCQKTTVTGSPNIMKKILRKKEEKEPNRRSLDLRFSQEIQTIPPPSLGDLSLTDAPSDVTEENMENYQKYLEATNSLELEPNTDGKFSYHQDSMKRYKKQVSRNSELLERNFKDDEEKGEVGV